MASGSFIGSKYGRYSNYYLAATWSSNSDVGTNASTLTVWVQLYRQAMYLGARTGTITVTYTDDNGTTHTLSSDSSIAAVSSGSAANYQIMTAAFTVPHKNDGSQSVSIIADYHTEDLSLSGYGTVVDMVASGSGTLDSIPRASTISAIYGNTIGSTFTVAIDRKYAGYRHVITVVFGGYTKEVAIEANASPQVSWTLEESMAAQIPNNPAGIGAVQVTTYNGAEQVGDTQSTNVTLYVPGYAVPAITSAVAEVINENSIVSGWGICLRGFSKAKVALGTTIWQGSEISSVSIVGGGFTGGANPYTTPLLKTAGATKFACKVTDHRGQTSAEAVTNELNVVDYYSPIMSTPPEWFRCTESGEASDTGQYLRVLVNGSMASCGGHNVMSIKMYSKLSSASSFDFLADLTNGTASTVGNNNFQTGFSYNIRFEITDSLGNKATYEDIVPTEHVALNIKPGGKGAAFGKVAEEDDLLDMGTWGIKSTIYRYSNGNEQLPIGYIFHWAPVNGQSIDLSTAEKVHEYFGFGTWTQIQDRLLLGAGSKAANAIGGEESHTLSVAELPPHSGTVNPKYQGAATGSDFNALALVGTDAWLVSDTIGEGKPHNNMPPYLVVYIWQRIA